MSASDNPSRLSLQAIRAALARVTASSGFAGAERMRRFILFIAEKTLGGEGETLKEYRIGADVFDRGPNFDPRTDTIVRVEARRLRKKLQEYYERAGRLDPVLITLPKGSYVPAFENREVVDAPAPAVPGPHAPFTAPIASIAVLPFLDLSPAKDQEYLCDGFSEELINALSTIPALKVAARTSAFRFKGKSEDIRRIGSDLNVEHIVEGSVRISGERLRVTVQLVHAPDGYHLWSRQFDRAFTEINAIQEDVARSVAASVGVELGSGVSFASSNSPEAYRYYLEGRHYWRHFLPASTAQAVHYFERTIRTDPSFAPAYAGLADAYMQMNVWGMAPPCELIQKARTAASRALSLDSNSAEAQAQLGAVTAFYDWDWSTSEQHFRRALCIQPNYVEAHWLFATACLGPQGRLDEALAEVRRATDLDPLSPLTRTMLGAVYFYRREFDQALEAFDAALRMDPSFMQASLFRGFVNLAQGRTDLASTSQDQSPYRLYLQAQLGNQAAARAEIEKLLAAHGNPLVIAAGYAGLDEQENSLLWLERAAEMRIPQMIWIHFQAPFESLHGTARYRAIRAGMRLL